MRLILFNISTNDLAEGVKGTFSQLAEDTKLSGTADLLEGKEGSAEGSG